MLGGEEPVSQRDSETAKYLYLTLAKARAAAEKLRESRTEMEERVLRTQRKLFQLLGEQVQMKYYQSELRYRDFRQLGLRLLRQELLMLVPQSRKEK
jgi:hypothetical protein